MPTSRLDQWCGEFAHHTNIPACVFRVYDTAKDYPKLTPGKPNIVLCPYDVGSRAYQMYGELFDRDQFSLIVADEGQLFKESKAKRTKMVRLLVSQNPKSFRITMSGTFFVNSYKDLESQAKYVNRAPWNDHKWWLTHRKYRQYINQWRTSCMYKIKRSDVASIIGLPEIIRHPTTELELTGKFFDFHEPLKNSIKRMVLCGVPPPGTTAKQFQEHILKRITYLAEICDHPSIVRDEVLLQKYASFDPPILPIPETEHSPKTAWIEKLVRDKLTAHPKTKIIIYSRFTRFLHVMKKFLDKLVIPNVDVRTGIICGGQTPKERTREKKAFLVDPELFPNARHTNVLLAATKAGGIGLNLTTGDHKGVMILADPNWNETTNFQAECRMHRIGQKHPVEIYRVVTSNTLEKWIDALSQKKHKEAQMWEEDGTITEKKQKSRIEELKLLFKAHVVGNLSVEEENKLNDFDKEVFDDDDEEAVDPDEVPDDLFEVEDEDEEDDEDDENGKQEEEPDWIQGSIEVNKQSKKNNSRPPLREEDSESDDGADESDIDSEEEYKRKRSKYFTNVVTVDDDSPHDDSIPDLIDDNDNNNNNNSSSHNNSSSSNNNNNNNNNHEKSAWQYVLDIAPSEAAKIFEYEQSFVATRAAQSE
jgi:hypothetical protein